MKHETQWRRIRAWIVLIVLSSAVPVGAQGKGLLNLIDIVDADALKSIEEILAFSAFDPDPANGTVRLVFEFADLDHETGISPTVILNRNGSRIAHFRPEVILDDTEILRNTHYHLIELSIAPPYLTESSLLIQFFPNTDKLVTYRVSFLAATVLRKSDGAVSRIPLADFLDSLRKDPASGDPGADDQLPTRTKSKAKKRFHP